MSDEPKYGNKFRHKFAPPGDGKINAYCVYAHIPVGCLMKQKDFDKSLAMKELRDLFYHVINGEIQKAHSEMLVAAFGKETAGKLRDFPK